MSDEAVPSEFENEVKAEARRRLRWVARMLARWPNFRMHLASSELGQAIGVADSVGYNAQEFLTKLRARMGHLDYKLVPPKGS